MSLENITPIVRYNLGILAAKDFDARELLWDNLGAKLQYVRHIFTNGTNPLVCEFAQENGIAYTVFPVSGGRGLPASTHEVVEASDYVLLISTPGSKSAGMIAEKCAAKAARPVKVDEPKFGWRTIEYDPYTHWREKVEQVREIMGTMSKAERAENPWVQAITSRTS